MSHEDINGAAGHADEVFTVTVRFYAAARAAAGTESDTVSVPAGTTMAGLSTRLARRGAKLSTVLDRCSFLRDGIAVRDLDEPLKAGETVDILPPFAGGGGEIPHITIR